MQRLANAHSLQRFGSCVIIIIYDGKPSVNSQKSGGCVPKMGWYLTTFSYLGMHPAKPNASFVPTADSLPFPNGKEYRLACFRLDGTCSCHCVNQVGERSRKSQVRDCPKITAQPTKSGLSLAQRILLRRGTFVQAGTVWMVGRGQ